MTTDVQRFQSAVNQLDQSFSNLRQRIFNLPFLHVNERYAKLQEIQDKEAIEIAHQIDDLKKIKTDLENFKIELKNQKKTYKSLEEEQIRLAYLLGSALDLTAIKKLSEIAQNLPGIQVSIKTEKNEATFRINALEAFVKSMEPSYLLEERNSFDYTPTLSNPAEPEYKLLEPVSLELDLTALQNEESVRSPKAGRLKQRLSLLVDNNK
jgi:TolA-binding protein